MGNGKQEISSTEESMAVVRSSIRSVSGTKQ